MISNTQWRSKELFKSDNIIYNFENDRNAEKGDSNTIGPN